MRQVLMIQYILGALALSPCLAAEDMGCAVPKSTVYVPVGTGQFVSPAIPRSKYSLVYETDRFYLVLVGTGTNRLIGRIPKFDSVMNPTANVDDDTIEIRTLVNTGVSEGYVPLVVSRRYPVVSESSLNYSVRFSYKDFSTVVPLAKTNSAYISAQDLRNEMLAEQDRQRREAARKFADAEAARQLEERTLADRRQKDEAMRQEELRMRQEELGEAARRSAEQAAEENARRQLAEDNERKIAAETQYTKLAIIDARAAKDYAAARAVITNALTRVSTTELAQQLFAGLDEIRVSIDQRERGERALRVGMVQVPQTVEGLMRDQARGNLGGMFWSADGKPSKLFAPTSWEIVSTELNGPDAYVKVRVDSSNKSGMPIRQIWTVTLTYEDRWRVVSISDE